MSTDTIGRGVLLLLATVLSIGLMTNQQGTTTTNTHKSTHIKTVGLQAGVVPTFIAADDDHKSIPKFLEHSLDWLAEAQFANGGWGAGMHNSQHIRDPKSVQIDPATTAFAATAMVRSGSTLSKGPYRKNIRLALDYLLELVEEAPGNNGKITTITGTQPQVKLGQNIDASMVSQFFSRVLPHVKDKKTRRRVEAALDRCLLAVQETQADDGSWSGPGWAPVLQSAMANSALELADAVGRKVDQDALDRSREYQSKNLNDEGEVKTEEAAGISLYSIAASQRAGAPQARKAKEAYERGLASGAIAKDAELNEETLVRSGVRRDEARKYAAAFRKNQVASELLEDDNVFAGFGNNGGEEFLSYMMTAESLAVIGGEEWDRWYGKMSNRLASIQNENGSWSGHHCITSPVFSTAAVIMTLTADRDRDVLRNRDQG